MPEKHYNASGTHVLVYNPETDARWECGEDYLPTALARGWELAEPVVEELAEQPEPKPRSRKAKPNPGD